MTNDDGQDPDSNLRERIVSLIRANQRARKKPVTADELMKLKAAANRLDRMMHHGADEDRQALKSAVGHLDQLLADIRAGKDLKIQKRK